MEPRIDAHTVRTQFGQIIPCDQEQRALHRRSARRAGGCHHERAGFHPHRRPIGSEEPGAAPSGVAGHPDVPPTIEAEITSHRRKQHPVSPRRSEVIRACAAEILPRHPLRGAAEMHPPQLGDFELRLLDLQCAQLNARPTSSEYAQLGSGCHRFILAASAKARGASGSAGRSAEASDICRPYLTQP
jgi:hypothetical protein